MARAAGAVAGSAEPGADGVSGVGGGAGGSATVTRRELSGSRPAGAAVAGVWGLWATAAEQRLAGAEAGHAMWDDPLATAGGTLSAGLRGVPGGAVGSGAGVVSAPAQGNGSPPMAG